MLEVLNLPVKRYWHFQYSRTFWEEKRFHQEPDFLFIAKKVHKKCAPSYRLGLV